jgi:hypothetical protein
VELLDLVRRRPSSAQAPLTPSAPSPFPTTPQLRSHSRIRRRRLLPRSAVPDTPAGGCSLGSAAAGEAEGCAAAGEESSASARAVAREESPVSTHAGPELSDMLTGGRSLGAWWIRILQPDPPRLAPPRMPPPEGGPTSACAAAGEEDRPPRRDWAGASPPCWPALPCVHGLLCLVCTVDHI